MNETYDFGGWATRNDLLCTDGRTIRKNAFKHNDGKVVPLVWDHQRTGPENVLGKAKLENRDDGVYAYCAFNDNEGGKLAKELVHHGDIRSLSICANHLLHAGSNVIRGDIKELSLVYSGANPGAFIDDVITHGDNDDESSVILGYDENITIYHSDDKDDKDVTEKEDKKEDKKEDEETIEDVFNSLSEKQKNVVYAIVGQVANAKSDDNKNEEDDNKMKKNVFEGKNKEENTLTHSDMEAFVKESKRLGSMRETFLAHADDYGIENFDYLFPDAKSLNTPPEFIKRDTDWVSKVMNAVHHTPFSRIKSVFANITEDDARARGYIKGNLKKEEVFALLKRTTTPTTIYKKQKMDRDDIVDITDFDVVAWIKSEMRVMLDEEIARTILIGDGRVASSDDKINEQNIRPIVSDDSLYTIKAIVNVANNATDDDKAKAFIRTTIKARKNYKGSGEPTLYTTEDVITDCLLLEDNNGRIIYDSLDKLKNVLRVKDIVTVPVMEGVTGANGGELMGIVVNLKDYNVGADKGGAINMFDDFDIDYNQQKYLIETRCSGALIKPYSAIAIELNQGA